MTTIEMKNVITVAIATKRYIDYNAHMFKVASQAKGLEDFVADTAIEIGTNTIMVSIPGETIATIDKTWGYKTALAKLMDAKNYVKNVVYEGF